MRVGVGLGKVPLTSWAASERGRCSSAQSSTSIGHAGGMIFARLFLVALIAMRDLAVATMTSVATLDAC